MVMKSPTTYANEIKSSTRYISMIVFCRLFHQQFLMPTKLLLYIDGISIFFIFLVVFLVFFYVCGVDETTLISYLSSFLQFSQIIFLREKKVRRLEGSAKLKNTKLDGILYVVMTIILVEKYTIEILIRKTQFRCS